MQTVPGTCSSAAPTGNVCSKINCIVILHIASVTYLGKSIEQYVGGTLRMFSCGSFGRDWNDTFVVEFGINEAFIA